MTDLTENALYKIHETDPNPDDPWGDDELNREPIAIFLTNLLSKVNTPFVLNLNSPWGTGKSFFLKRWMLSICKDFPCLFFNVWESDYSNDPLVAFIAEMKNQLLQIASKSPSAKKR